MDLSIHWQNKIPNLKVRFGDNTVTAVLAGFSVYLKFYFVLYKYICFFFYSNHAIS